MSEDLTGGAPAPADTTAVVETPSNTPEPIAESTPRAAIDRAFDAVEKLDTGATAKPVADKTKAEPVAAPVTTEGERERNPDGTFKPKSDATGTQPAQVAAKTDAAAVDPAKAPAATGDAPARFAADPDAKAAWAQTPEPVKAATLRVIGEMERGIEKYRGDATVFNDHFKPFIDLALKSNVDPKATLQNYVNIDTLLSRDFTAGVTQIFKNKGIDPRAWAAELMGKPAPVAQPQDQTIEELRREIAGLKQGFQGVSQTIESQRGQQINQSLEGFTASLPDADKALFTELDAEVAAHLQADPSTTLADAFAKAKQDAQDRYKRMFGTALPTAAAQTREPNLEAQTLKGSLSVTGAPSSGSDPASRKPPSSPREALDRAFGSVGL